MSDVERPSTWKVFKASLCSGCQAFCCRLPVEASVSDLVRLGLLNEDESLWSAKKIARKLKDSGHVQSFRSRSMLFTLQQRPTGDCVFLGADRLCQVYDKRPNVCRRFPEVGPRPGYCPHRSVTTRNKR